MQLLGLHFLFTKESKIDPDLIGRKSPLTPLWPPGQLPARREALWAGGQRGGIPPFRKRREGGI